jgi:hypothetical protein
MSFLIAAPEMVVAAATDLARVGSTISAANVVAAAPTSSVIAAGADQVSASIAALFGAHAEAYQALSAQAATFHNQFVQALTSAPTITPAPRRLTPRRCRPCSKTCSTRSMRPARR